MARPKAIQLKAKYPTVPASRSRRGVGEWDIMVLDLEVTDGPAGTIGRYALLTITTEQARKLIVNLQDQLRRAEGDGY